MAVLEFDPYNVDRCHVVNCIIVPLNNLYFPQEDVYFEIWVLKATVQKLLLTNDQYIWKYIKLCKYSDI